MHKISHDIVQHIETNSLTTLIVGKNVGWEEGIELGQRFFEINLFLFYIKNEQ